MIAAAPKTGMPHWKGIGSRNQGAHAPPQQRRYMQTWRLAAAQIPAQSEEGDTRPGGVGSDRKGLGRDWEGVAGTRGAERKKVTKMFMLEKCGLLRTLWS